MENTLTIRNVVDLKIYAPAFTILCSKQNCRRCPLFMEKGTERVCTNVIAHGVYRLPSKEAYREIVNASDPTEG